MGSQKTAVVAGDLLVDWGVAVDSEILAAARSWKEAGRVHRYNRRGGAWLAAELIEGLAKDVKDWSIAGPPKKIPDHVHTTHSLLAPQSDGVWRIDPFLGVERASQALTPALPPTAAQADLLVLLDSGLGFMAEAVWPQRLTKNPWIILKSGEPDLETPFGRSLVEHHAARTIVVMTADDLRRMEVHVSRRLSWERTAQETVDAIRKCSLFGVLERGGQVIVSFGAAGAVLIGSGMKSELVFDPSVMEGEWEKANPGTMIGASTILAASIAYEVMTSKDQPSMPRAIERGITGMRALVKNGYGDRAGGLSAIACPIDRVVKEALNSKLSLSRVEIESSPTCTSVTTYIARESAKLNVPPDDYLHQLASAVAVFGPEQMLTGVPHLKIGGLFTADRTEIESFRSVKSLLAEYVKSGSSRPFSIAVFGPPGSGKSFGVEQVAESISPSVKIEKLTFNLTQFAEPKELHGAYHQVRDVALRGKIPLVFWDEFDTRQGGAPLGWPRHFIGPMQDGAFQDGPHTHPIGTSIFVFAGGTCATFAEFTTWDEELDQERRQLKIPDFISRLKGHLNVLGPNCLKSGSDPFHVIRRAILLRSLLLRHAGSLFITEGTRKILQIEREVLCSFLHADEYRYGARSLEAIITMSSLAGRKIFDGSSLPPEAQRAMHVTKFDCPPAKAKRRFGDDLIDIEQLAERAHQIFSRTRRNHGWTYGPVRNDEEKVHNLLVDYGALSWADKESNRDTVRKIPEKLEAIHATVQPASPGERRPQLTEADIAKLAPIEHDRWMKLKAQEGFTLGKPTKDEPRKSPYMVPWEKLPQEFKETDINMVSAIPDMLAEAGYTFVRNTKP